MSKYFFFLFFSFFSLCSNTALSQTHKIEELKKIFYNSKTQSQKLLAVLALCDQSHSLNIDTLKQYAFLAKQMAIDLHQKNEEILADTYIGNWLGRKALYDSAIKICNQDLKNINYKNAGEIYSKVQKQKCLIVIRTNNHKEALDELYHFLQESEQNEDTASQLFCKCAIATVYRNMGQTELTMQWLYKANQTVATDEWEEIKNDNGLFFLLGMMYNWKQNEDADPKTALDDSSTSLKYLDRAINDSRKFENLFILARALNVKASEIGNPEHVKLEGEYVTEAEHIYELLHDTISILNSISPMCFYYIDEGHPEKGIKACEDGIAMVKRGNQFPVVDIYEALSQCYKASGDYKKYSETLTTIIFLKDSIYKINSERDLAELNAKYEDQKKENTIIQQKLDISAKRNSMYVISILLGLLSLGIFFLYRYYTKKQKEQKQNELLAIASAEEAERKRISADLHDNIGAYAAAASSTISTIQPKDEQSGNTLIVLKENVQEMITQLNDSIWALNRQSILLTGISDRFKLFVQKLENAYPQINIIINEEIEEDRLLSPFQALHLFRILQEALNNALRHSQCKNVNIHFQSDKSSLMIEVADDGIGLTVKNQNGNGLKNLKTRANESGWEAKWITNAEGGTTVVISNLSNGKME